MKSGLLFGLLASGVIVAACEMPDTDRERDIAPAAETETIGTTGTTSAGAVFEPGALDADQAITSEVEANILAHPSLERDIISGDLDVYTDDGTVTLTGSVGSQAEKELARTVAWSVAGVTEVQDSLSVE